MTRLSSLFTKSLITPITAALFLIVAFTGVLLLFHMGGATAKEIHELLSLAFVAAAVLHLVLNWRIFAAYLKKPATIGLGVAVVLVLAMVLGGKQQGGGSPAMQVFGLIENAPLTNFAPLVGVEASQAAEILRRGGLVVSDENQTVGDIARKNGRRLPEVLALFRTAAAGPNRPGAPVK
jgi:hypothetical protein